MAILGIGPAEAGFERRGFAGSGAARTRLEAIGRTFIHGYRAALADDRADAIARALASVDDELRGFAYEGAAMAVTLRDLLAPWRRARLDDLLRGPGGPHRYMVHVGAGWAFARTHRGPAAAGRLDPLLRWLALDGYGFHQGYFAPERHLRRGAVRRGFTGYAGRAFDQGLGRSLWFAEGAQPEAIATRIGGFPHARRADVWSGVGLAATYAGAASADAVARVRALAGPHAAHVAQGAAFAAAARARAGNPALHTELACRILTGLSADRAAAVTADAARGLPPDGVDPAYEVWRRRIRTTIGATTTHPPAVHWSPS